MKGQKKNVDGISYIIPPCSILPLVSNQYFVFENPEKLIAWQFNREFYCIAEHDTEVSCVGLLFYGIHHPMFILLCSEELREVEKIERLFLEDMSLKDSFQGEMLRTVLKRLIINITRLALKQIGL